MKQKLILEEQLLTKQKKNGKRLNKLISACECLYDYKILMHLLADGYFNGTPDFDLELFTHRIGKILNVKLEEEKIDANDKV